MDTVELIGGQVAESFGTTDLAAWSLGVSWAGVDPAPMWLDCAREFTEFWVHRQQIRHAVGQGTDPDPRPFEVVLSTFMRALPHTLDGVSAADGTQVRIEVDGAARGTWTATADGGRWSLADRDLGRPLAVVRLDAETAWRLCTRGIQPKDAMARAELSGDRRLAAAACQIVSIVY